MRSGNDQEDECESVSHTENESKQKKTVKVYNFRTYWSLEIISVKGSKTPKQGKYIFTIEMSDTVHIQDS